MTQSLPSLYVPNSQEWYKFLTIPYQQIILPFFNSWKDKISFLYNIYRNIINNPLSLMMRQNINFITLHIPNFLPW